MNIEYPCITRRANTGLDKLNRKPIYYVAFRLFRMSLDIAREPIRRELSTVFDPLVGTNPTAKTNVEKIFNSKYLKYRLRSIILNIKYSI